MIPKVHVTFKRRIRKDGTSLSSPEGLDYFSMYYGSSDMMRAPLPLLYQNEQLIRWASSPKLVIGKDLGKLHCFRRSVSVPAMALCTACHFVADVHGLLASQ